MKLSDYVELTSRQGQPAYFSLEAPIIALVRSVASEGGHFTTVYCPGYGVEVRESPEEICKAFGVDAVEDEFSADKITLGV